MVSRLAPGGCLPVVWKRKTNRGFPGFSRRGGPAFQFRLLHPNLATWGWPMNNEKNEIANLTFSLIWVYRPEPASKEVWCGVPYNVHIDKRVWLTAISPDGRAAGLTDARNFILAVPVSSELLPRSIKPADGQRSLLKGSSSTLLNARGTANTHMGPTPVRWWMSETSPNDCGSPYVDASCGRADPMKRCVADTRSSCYLGMVSVHGFTPSSPI